MFNSSQFQVLCGSKEVSQSTTINAWPPEHMFMLFQTLRPEKSTTNRHLRAEVLSASKAYETNCVKPWIKWSSLNCVGSNLLIVVFEKSINLDRCEYKKVLMFIEKEL
jgi:hypothetical protein